MTRQAFTASRLRFDDPLAVALDQHAVAREFVERMVVTRQRLDHDFTRIAQRGDARAQRFVVLPWREDRAAARLDGRDTRDFAQKTWNSTLLEMVIETGREEVMKRSGER